jgi:hypothetical protein
MLFKSSELERLRNAGFVLRDGKLWVRDPCNVCRASGRIPCPGCKGTGTRTEDCIHCDSGRVLCPRCGGAGRMPCEECRGMRSLACPDCSGVGKLRCERCGGRGRMERGCGHCGGNRWQHGSGTVRRRVRGRDLEWGASWEIDRVTCPRCRGAGVLSRPCSACRATGAMQCPRCRGAGVLACERCGGKGWMECEHTQECLYCGGRGTLEAACSRCRGEETIPCDECGGRGFTGTSEPVRPVPPEEIETGGGVVFFKVGAGNPGETGTKSGSPRDSSPAERNADDSKPGG